MRILSTNSVLGVHNIQLTDEEVAVLKGILCHVGGDPDRSYRRVADDIRCTLSALSALSALSEVDLEPDLTTGICSQLEGSDSIHFMHGTI